MDSYSGKSVMDCLGVKIIQELGRGSSGTVYKVQSLEDGKFYVVKVVDFCNIPRQQQISSQQEVEILKDLDHVHIIKYYACVVAENRLYIQMEYAPGGDLQQLIQAYKDQKKSMDERIVWNLIYELALAIKYLHSRRIVHRDLKCMNVLLDSDHRVKIGDLGLSTVMDKKLKSKVGTPLFLSPEQVRRLPYGFKVDIWALGCILHYMAALEAPFLGDNLITLGNNIVQKPTPTLPPKYSAKLGEFLHFLLRKDPKNRPNASEVLRLLPPNLRQTYKAPATVKALSRSGFLDTKDQTLRYKMKYKQCVEMAKCTRSSSTYPDEIQENGSPDRHFSHWISKIRQQRRITTIRDLVKI